MADTNGTLEAATRRALRLARGSARVVPVVFFLIAMTVSTIEPEAVAAVALVAPVAMALGARSGVPALLTALMVGNGADAGNLSPLSAVGVIANSRMAGVGLGGHAWKVWAASFAAHVVVGAAAWLMFGGLRPAPEAAAGTDGGAGARLTAAQWLTVAVIACWVTAVVAWKWHRFYRWCRLWCSRSAAATLWPSH